MMNDDYQRGLPQQGRKPYQPKYTDNRYHSPSSNYNYNHNANPNGYGNPQQQHPKRKPERFKRESPNFTERIARQNDIIIRLLKEIRDRLPAPASAASPSAEGETESANLDHSTEETQKSDDTQTDSQELSPEDTEIGNEMKASDEPADTGNR